MNTHQVWLVLLGASLMPSVAAAQLSFERPPIDYQNAAPTDAIARLQQQMDDGSFQLEYDSEQGYLPSLLEALDVPVSSQVLVFSKTSLQIRHIEPKQPRAIYFNDDVYVGNTRHGDVYEISAVDPQLGAVFYTLDQRRADAPKFVRDKGQCLTCHASSRTADVPGHLVRSVFPDHRGHPIIGSGTFTTDHTSPLSQRWGGWYVTGTHGKQRHMGNVIVASRANPEKLDVEDGANVTDLSDRVNVSPYLTPHSDIVALMVLEHQAQMHNLITRANFETRVATGSDKMMNEMLDRDPDYRSPSTQRRIERVGDRLLEYLLFCGEYSLEAPIRGTSGFAEEFAARGPRDQKGRSLRDLDLNTRLMKYPCSYLIYSESFAALPAPVKDYVSRRLYAVLIGTDTSEKFSHLTSSDRSAILAILQDTKPGLFASRDGSSKVSKAVNDTSPIQSR